MHIGDEVSDDYFGRGRIIRITACGIMVSFEEGIVIYDQSVLWRLEIDPVILPINHSCAPNT